MKKITVEKAKAVRIVSHYADFDQTKWNSDATEDQKAECWKMAFYEMWRYQMAWGYAYEIAVRDGRKSGVFISILAKESFADNAKDTMESIGFGEIAMHDEYVALTDGFDLDDETYSVFID